jgi:hypothetical protein
MDINRVSGFEKCPETSTRLVYDFWKDYIYQGTRLVYQNGDVSPTTTLPNQQHSHKLHKKNKGDPFTP